MKRAGTDRRTLLALCLLATGCLWVAGCHKATTTEPNTAAVAGGPADAGDKPAMSEEDMGAGAMGAAGGQEPGGPGFSLPKPEPGDVTTVFGSAASWDAATGLLVVTQPFVSPDQEGTQVHVGEGVPFLRFEDCEAADLAEGDMLSASGQPTALEAATLTTAAEEFASAVVQGPPRRGGRRGQASPSGGYSFGMAVGEIVSTSPLRIKVSDEITAEVTLEDGAVFQRMVESDQAPSAEEMIVCQGEVGDDGSVTADFVLVMPPFEGGGPGGGPGRGGPGGGSGPGGGGPGGPRGGQPGA